MTVIFHRIGVIDGLPCIQDIGSKPKLWSKMPDWLPYNMAGRDYTFLLQFKHRDCSDDLYSYSYRLASWDAKRNQFCFCDNYAEYNWDTCEWAERDKEYLELDELPTTTTCYWQRIAPGNL